MKILLAATGEGLLLVGLALAHGSQQITRPTGLSELPYQFTRTHWAAGATDHRPRPIANRKAYLRQSMEITQEMTAQADVSSFAPPEKPHTTTPQVHILREDFLMPQLNRRRRVWIYLPADYAQQPTRRYPVLYLQDGQNVFDEATSFAGEWGVDETLDELRASGRDTIGCIVVAIDNGGPFRGDEYIPWRNETQKVGGQGGAYVDFLALTLKPFIDRAYRTRPDAASTGIAGSSLGGLISVYAALRYPKVFGRVAAFSPAFWICNDKLLTYVRKRPAAPGTKFYFVGGQDESRWMVPQMTAWRDVLRTSGVPAAHLSLNAPTDGKHQEWFWRREFAAAYEWLFEPNKKE